MKYLRNEVPFFKDTMPKTLKEIAKSLVPRQIQMGSVIYSQEENNADSFYVIMQGTVELKTEQQKENDFSTEKDTVTYITRSNDNAISLQANALNDPSNVKVKIPGEVFGFEEYDESENNSIKIRKYTAIAITTLKVF